MDIATGLSRLEAEIATDLEKIAWPRGLWVKPHTSPDGIAMHNVIIVGGGQGGLTCAFQLMRERVDNVLVIDRHPPEKRGPWKTYGRMITLRSPKETTGPDLDIPNLTFRAWYEAQHGPGDWAALGKIPKEMWADYLAWFERVLALPVRAGLEAVAIRPHDTHVEVDVDGEDGTQTLHTRHLVLATGIETPGRWWMPRFLEALPQDRINHTGDAIDFTRLEGKIVAVLGAGASAFDNAATALEAGADVHLFWRRDEIQRVQPYKHISYAGILRHLGDLPDAMRWRFMRHLLTLREAFPAETWARVTDQDRAVLHPGRGWTGAQVLEDGKIEIATSKGPFHCDHIIAGTGFDMDLGARPELRAIAGKAALWSDRFTPLAPADEDTRLLRYPYLGPHFEMQAKMPADAAALARIRLFTFGATMSFGPSGASINALKFATPRLVSGITRDLFREDAGAHLADLLAYDTPEF